MPFSIVNIETGQTVYLNGKISYKVGRKDCDILLEEDASISREHAIFRLKGDHVTLEDPKSKYGTFIQNTRIDNKIEKQLQHMDEIKFGIYKNIFRFESYKFLVAASALSADKKDKLKEDLVICNAKYLDKWCEQCTHLTVDTLTLTIKVLQALVEEKPIVTLDYWTAYASSIENKQKEPDINQYSKPPIGEQLLRSDFEYKVNPLRKTLFKDKLFVFLNVKTKKQMEDVIKSCGGTCISWDEEPKTMFDINRSPLDHLLIKTETDEPNVSFDAIVKELAKENKRAIPINEIALAIVHGSCDVNCNPMFNKVSEVFKATTQQQKNRDVLAIETQSQNLPAIKTEKIIPASIDDDFMLAQDVASGVKRSAIEEQSREGLKKAKVEINSSEEAKQPTVDNFVGRQKKAESSHHDSSKAHNLSETSNKRKATDEPDTSSSLKLNPFPAVASLPKKFKNNSENNPFQLIRNSSKPAAAKATVKNPFANIMNVSKRPSVTIEVEDVKPAVIAETRKEIRLIPVSDFSGSSSNKKSFLNISWMSKASFKIEAVKVEEDEELAKIAEAFRNCVKVEVKPLCELTVSKAASISLDNVDGKKNFKKFKKVQPLRPQVTIISRQQLMKIAPGDVTGIEIDAANDSEEERRPASSSKSKKPTGTLGRLYVL